MDSDNFSLGGQIPFFLQKDFTGIIPAGTPIAQLIPIKRDSWKSEVLPHNQGFVKTQLFNVSRYLYGGYKKHLWVKKSYD
jgi:hypothetical protein